ncbi:uncharacterized protein DUF4244 [Saccharothrix carnea]|uniref:Uncharacterized protein DUF4244 n=1 Tax=Saccharothrix carnea TaxID=1280637 RepID=A0A2P8IB25_SACCR|nr:DUF4244 domain-containing protein [Saccharothrix carnea]PSL55653.1 uncharacterized protein DUF4244 [Saccharothrix carnea]
MVAGKRIVLGDGGMSTVEYAIGTLAAAALALLLFALMSGDWVQELLRALVLRAFTVDT